ncbi:response regulator [candidate division WOR-3 bacterium]|nr:response regulator [candidate division WOR-3 bacterium]
MEQPIERKSVLVVDDEKNIRLMMARALEATEYEVATAVNGEEALAALGGRRFDVMLLDLNMPGMDGMAVLRRVAREHADVRVVIVTAYGTVERAVEAMRLGAVDFLEKPVTPDQVRVLLREMFDRPALREERAKSYQDYLQLAKRCINERRFEAAFRLIEKAVALDSSKAEAFNLKGVLFELQGDVPAAQKMYRVALQLDPGYRQARANLDHSGTFSASRDRRPED